MAHNGLGIGIDKAKAEVCRKSRFPLVRGPFYRADAKFEGKAGKGMKVFREHGGREKKVSEDPGAVLKSLR